MGTWRQGMAGCMAREACFRGVVYQGKALAVLLGGALCMLVFGCLGGRI